jgi:hypothetical protein
MYVLCPEPFPSKGKGALLKMEGIAGVRENCGGRANCLAGLLKQRAMKWTSGNGCQELLSNRLMLRPGESGAVVNDKYRRITSVVQVWIKELNSVKHRYKSRQV